MIEFGSKFEMRPAHFAVPKVRPFLVANLVGKKPSKTFHQTDEGSLLVVCVLFGFNDFTMTAHLQVVVEVTINGTKG